MEVRSMRMSYKKLWLMLVEKEISQATLRKDLNIATGTMTKLRRNEEVALSVLLRICEYLDCNIGDICDAVRVRRCGFNAFCTVRRYCRRVFPHHRIRLHKHHRKKHSS